MSEIHHDDSFHNLSKELVEKQVELSLAKMLQELGATSLNQLVDKRYKQEHGQLPSLTINQSQPVK